MRLFHLLMAVFITALILAISRHEVGRIMLVVFLTGLGEFIFGAMAVMTLFQTIGSIGQANRLLAYLQALAATALVLLVATATMNGILWLGWWLLTVVAPY
jgi:hypothetical protein